MLREIFIYTDLFYTSYAITVSLSVHLEICSVYTHRVGLL